MVREKSDGSEAVPAFFSGLLPILDGLEAVRRLILQAGAEEWQRGISILYEKVLSYCGSFGLVRSAVVGKPFDSSFHEAVGVADDPGVEEGCVCEVVQQGWLYGGKALRFARVIVARHEERSG